MKILRITIVIGYLEVWNITIINNNLRIYFEFETSIRGKTIFIKAYFIDTY